MSAISVSWLNVSWGAVYIETNYGLMQHSYTEIKQKLLGALDSEYNVVDMATVFEVVAVLEKTPITPEILETTRLGKYINECRKRTNNEALSRRAKLLVRHWRDMIELHNNSTSSASAITPAAQSTVIPPPAASPPQHNGTSVRSSTQRPLDRVPTPSVSPALSAPLSTVGRVSNVYDSKVSPSSSLSPGRDPKVESVPKTHVANKRLRKNPPPLSPPAWGEPPAKASKVNGAMFVEKPDSPSPVVNEAPLEECSRVNETPVVDEESANAVAGPITENVPEPDPPLPKKRSRKKANKKKLSEDDIVKEKLVAMSKTKRVKTTEELVAELKSRNEDRLSASTSEATALDGKSVKPSLSNNVRANADTAVASAESIAEPSHTKQERLDPETRVEREIAEIMSKLPPLNVDEIRWDSPEPSPPSSPKPITDEDVDRYLDQRWDGVNGCVTHSSVPNVQPGESDDNFREWHEMVSRRTLNDDMIHILPYSIVD